MGSRVAIRVRGSARPLTEIRVPCCGSEGRWFDVPGDVPLTPPPGFGPGTGCAGRLILAANPNQSGRTRAIGRIHLGLSVRPTGVTGTLGPPPARVKSTATQNDGKQARVKLSRAPEAPQLADVASESGSQRPGPPPKKNRVGPLAARPRRLTSQFDHATQSQLSVPSREHVWSPDRARGRSARRAIVFRSRRPPATTWTRPSDCPDTGKCLRINRLVGAVPRKGSRFPSGAVRVALSHGAAGEDRMPPFEPRISPERSGFPAWTSICPTLAPTPSAP